MNAKYQIARWIGHQHWLRGRGQLVSWLCPSGESTGQEFNAEFFGCRYQGQLDDFIDRHVYLFGGWELHILALMSQLAKACRAVNSGPVTYVDVGANTGQHALFMSRHVNTAICFEPYEPVRRRLEQRIVSNHLRNVTVAPLALSSRRGDSSYYSPEGCNQGTGSLVASFSGTNRSQPITVPTEIGDSYFQDPSKPHINILKIDVEGGERGVLEGLRETLRRSRPAVIVELSEYTQNDLQTLDRLYTLLYADAMAFRIDHHAWRAGYRLRPCDFRAPSDILIVPRELAPFIPLAGGFAAAPRTLADSPHANEAELVNISEISHSA